MVKMKPFKSLHHYYKVTGDPQKDKLCPNELIIGAIRNKGLLLKLLKPRLEWQNHYEARIVTVRFVINRVRPGTTIADPYVVEYTNVYVQPHNWCNARQKCLLRLWLKIKNPNG